MKVGHVIIYNKTCYFSLSLYSSDKMGIKTTVHEIIAAKQNRDVPEPKTRDDFLKCKSLLSY